MRFSHNFGTFHPSVTVDGATFTFEDYKSLDCDARKALRKAIVDRCVAANVRVGDAARAIQSAIRAEYQTKIDALPKPGRKASRQEKADYRNKVQDLMDARQDEMVAVWNQPNFRVEGNTYPAAVDDIVTVWESRVETDKEKLARYLANFDWYYEYSDDFRVWSAGNARAMEIRTLVGKLGAEGQAMFDAARPK